MRQCAKLLLPATAESVALQSWGGKRLEGANREENESSRRKQVTPIPANPFRETVGIQTVSAKDGHAVCRLPLHAAVANVRGVIHGGAIATLCDGVIGTAIRSALKPGDSVATIELKVNFMAPAEGDLEARAKVLHVGGRTAVGEVDVYCEANGKLVAKALATFAVLRGSVPPRPGATTAMDPEFDGPESST